MSLVLRLLDAATGGREGCRRNFPRCPEFSPETTLGSQDKCGVSGLRCRRPGIRPRKAYPRAPKRAVVCFLSRRVVVPNHRYPARLGDGFCSEVLSAVGGFTVHAPQHQGADCVNVRKSASPECLVLRVHVVRRRDSLSTGSKGPQKRLAAACRRGCAGNRSSRAGVLPPPRCESVAREAGRLAAAPCGAARLVPFPWPTNPGQRCGGMRRSKQ